jgi:formate hydrogenlyase subunit 3/multisubunit Na+/H+ antiporter MnhD subunit
MIIAPVLLAFFSCAIAGLVFGRREQSHAILYAVVAVLCVVLAGHGLLYLFATGGEVQQIVLPIGLPWLGAHFRLDRLSAFFLLVVNLPGALASLYAVAYGSHVPHPARVTPLFPLFLLGMNGVVIADDCFVFLFFWEVMSVASWLLVVSDHERDSAQRAGHLYLVMAVVGTFCLLAAFGLMAGAGGAYDFASLRAAHLEPLAGGLVVALALVGAGSKAGLVPMHVWLPVAHPAAPSHVSALMSGAMTKVAVYAMVRILFDLEGAAGWGLAVVLMVMGALTAVLSILQALFQRDMKTILAYSTVENMGIIAIALGLAAAFRDRGEPAFSALALVAALYHVINHALIKTTLFLGAGAVQMATGERDLDKLGGLLNRMKWTGLTFLIGAAAISALPPLNGFVSEWLIFQSLFKGPSIAQWAMRFGVPVVGVAMALAAAFAATCFVRTFGIAFLGRARSEAAKQAIEVPMAMRLAMAIPAVLCFFLGVIPVTVSTGIATIAEPLVGVRLPASILGWPYLSPVSLTGGSYSATVLIIFAAVLMGVTLGMVHWLGPRQVRRARAWDCGHDEIVPLSQYSADSFSQPLRRVFGTTLFSARETVEMPEPGDLGAARFTLSMRDPLWDGVYSRLERVVDVIAEQANRLQNLTVRGYLILMFSTLVLLLVVVAVRQS